jgi:hypothetical protein
MVSPKHAISKPSVAIALKYGKNVSKGITEMENTITGNEKPMAYESAFKSCTELVRDTDFQDLTYEQRIKAVLDQAEIVGDWIVRKGGA